jgi:outer membrane protein OmpA-like peptidoglycan-associated protein
MAKHRQVMSFGILILAGCASGPTKHHDVAMYTFLDPASGITYRMPMRSDLRGGLYSVRTAGLAGTTTATPLDEYVSEGRKSTTAGQAAGMMLASAGRVAVAHVTARTTSNESAQSSLPVSRLESAATEPVQSSREAERVNLKLDSTFASAKRLIRFAVGAASLGPIGKLAIAELVPWAKQAEKVHVRGGADLSGNADQNRQLAMARAASVSSAFVAAGVDGKKISKSYCTECYVAENATQQGRRINRRVDVELVLKQELITKLPPPVHAQNAPDTVALMHTTALR